MVRDETMRRASLHETPALRSARPVPPYDAAGPFTGPAGAGPAGSGVGPRPATPSRPAVTVSQRSRC